jgi:hypothetical protein
MYPRRDNMQTNGVIDRFNVQSILMLTHLHTPDTVGRQEKRRKEPDSAGFNSVLNKQVLTVKATP